jgi:hypothetical protein
MISKTLSRKGTLSTMLRVYKKTSEKASPFHRKPLWRTAAFTFFYQNPQVRQPANAQKTSPVSRRPYLAKKTKGEYDGSIGPSMTDTRRRRTRLTMTQGFLSLAMAYCGKLVDKLLNFLRFGKNILIYDK